MVLRMSSTILVDKQSLEDILDENRKLRAELKECRERISSLEAEVKTLRRKLYGKKSERLPKRQKKNSPLKVTTDLTLSEEDKAILKSLLAEEPALLQILSVFKRGTVLGLLSLRIKRF